MTEPAAAFSVVVVVVVKAVVTLNGRGDGGGRVPVLMTQNSVRAARTPLRHQTSFDVAAT